MAWPTTFPISYAELGSLPADPRALASRLDRISGGHALQLIGELFVAYLMPPALTAELFQALGDVPGVTVVKDAVDRAGRHGVAFRLPAAASRAYQEIILDPGSYQFMGWGDGPDGTTVLALATVSGPGARP
jgi:hypothetical protein